MYISFSVCLHRHSTGVLRWGSMSTQLSHLIYRLSAVASSEPVKVWSSQVLILYSGLTLSPFPFIRLSLSPEFSRYYLHTEVPVLWLVLSLPLVAICIVYLAVFFILSAGTCWAERRPVCVCVLCMLPRWSQAVRPRHACVQRRCRRWSLRGHDFKLVPSFCLLNTS